MANSSTPARAIAPSFINMAVHGNGGVYNTARKRFLVITPGTFVKNAKLFESRTGKTLYVFVDETGLRVFNADNGDHLRDLPFYRMPMIGEFNRAHAELEFDAKISEDESGIVVAVLPAREKLAWRNVKTQPWLKLHLASGKIETALN